MMQFPKPEPLTLILLDLPNLTRLSSCEAVDLGDLRVLDDALPPPRIAEHALSQLKIGTPAEWCVPFLIVSDNAVLGTCRFRASPADGCVEIGYEVAASQRGRGIATQAVRQLIHIAASSGQVKQVVAHIVPENLASSKVVSRLGFLRRDTPIDHDGTTVVLWTLSIAT